jgi:mRNA interferase RelE/StbE
VTWTELYDVQLAQSAARVFRKLEKVDRDRIRRALERLAIDVTKSGRGGKAIKTIHGTSDRFHRLRAGDFRIMYDVVDEGRVILVLGIVHRAELERWLRNR